MLLIGQPVAKPRSPVMRTDPMSEFIPVLEVDHLEAESSQLVTVEGRDILLCQSGGEVFAVDPICTHQRESLAGGRIRRGHVSCPLHGARFNLRTGEPVGQLTRVPLKTYDVQVESGVVAIKVE